MVPFKRALSYVLPCCINIDCQVLAGPGRRSSLSCSTTAEYPYDDVACGLRRPSGHARRTEGAPPERVANLASVIRVRA